MGIVFILFGPPVVAFFVIVCLPTVRANAIGLLVVAIISGLLIYSGVVSKPSGPDDWYNGIEALVGFLAIAAALFAGALRGTIDHFRKRKNSLKYAVVCGATFVLWWLASEFA